MGAGEEISPRLIFSLAGVILKYPLEKDTYMYAEVYVDSLQ